MLVSEQLTLSHYRQHNVLAVDFNKDHLAVTVLAPDGNPVAAYSVALCLNGNTTSTRDAILRHGVTTLISLAAKHECLSVAIENLGFDESRSLGKDKGFKIGSPTGKAAKRFRKTVAGMPTAKFRSRLVQMCYRKSVGVLSVEPAHTSQLGLHYWKDYALTPKVITIGSYPDKPVGTVKQNLTCRNQSVDKPSIDLTMFSSHHAASIVIGRFGLGLRAGRKSGLVSGGGGSKQSIADRSKPVADTQTVQHPAGGVLAQSNCPVQVGKTGVGNDDLTLNEHPPGRCGKNPLSAARGNR